MGVFNYYNHNDHHFRVPRFYSICVRTALNFIRVISYIDAYIIFILLFVNSFSFSQ